ncbi:TetR/AcrR family transcriptional regulator [Nocardioides sp. TF02-7]|uniref:TetR/AcrR family transcriptional regulator n=1 Tax=Nocardioides sp. TF02-7 TaxID=2917724 RepID=UPI001F05CF53|nr:TetR/AcrR family transcriptional regulator [Nocardioides sp. TF02-7]UMG93270.1 TetR/AcrR family transcriptional regulator [Nocardioides sp. TF02-7]
MPRIAADSLRKHRAHVHRKVFDAFVELMGERSYDAITMAGLAERAGLGRTAIYHHFRDKEAVLVAFATHTTTAYVAELREALAGRDDPAAELRTYVRHQLEAGERFHIGLGPALSGSLSDTARREIRQHVVAVETVLRDILGRGRAQGAFTYDDLDATVSLLHACLSPRHLPARSDRVVRAAGGRRRGPGSVTRTGRQRVTRTVRLTCTAL